MEKIIYDVKTHSLQYIGYKSNIPNFWLTIGTLELAFEVKTGKFLFAQGFFPLIKALRTNVDFFSSEKKDYFLNNLDLSKFRQNEVYDLMHKFPETKKYFDFKKVKYDKKRSAIQVGEKIKKGDKLLEISNSLFCGIDENSVLKCIIMFPEFICKNQDLPLS